MQVLARIRAYRLTPAHWVFAAVFCFRLWNLARLTLSPMLLPARGDMHFYDEWAQRILRGELTDGHAFYGLPLYAYLLAGIYKIFGYGPFIPGLLQALLDAGTATIIYLLIRRIMAAPAVWASGLSGASVSSPALPVLGAAAWALFVPAQAYSLVLMPTSWFVFVFWLVVWLIVQDDVRPSPVACLGFGVILGVTAMGVATILFLIPLVFAALILKSGRTTAIPAIPKPNPARWRAAATGALLLMVGVVVGTAPCWVHNYFVAHDPVALSAHSGINFWIGNNPEAAGYPRFPPGLRAGQAAMLADSIHMAEAAAGRALKRGEVSAFWSQKARHYIAEHPMKWLRQMAEKIGNFWSAFQYDDLSVITSLREHRVILPGIYFGLIAALAIPGLVLAWPVYPRSRWITGAVLLHLCALLPVFVTERYRLAAVPGLTILAVIGLFLFWRNLVVRRWQFVASFAALLCASSICVAWPKRDASLWALDAYNSGWQALQANDLSLAEKKLTLARAYVPDNAETNFAFGNLRLAQGNDAAAELFYRETLRIDRHHKGALNNLGVVSLDRRDLPAARLYFEAALAQDSQEPKTHYLLARVAFLSGDLPGADEELSRAVRLGGDRPEFVDLREQIRGQRR